jgi:hypothetical protein
MNNKFTDKKRWHHVPATPVRPKQMSDLDRITFGLMLKRSQLDSVGQLLDREHRLTAIVATRLKTEINLITDLLLTVAGATPETMQECAKTISEHKEDDIYATAVKKSADIYAPPHSILVSPEQAMVGVIEKKLGHGA